MNHLRLGTKNDIPNICQLLISTWQSCYADFIPQDFLDNLNLAHQIRRHTSSMEKGIIYFIIENDQKELLGFASFGKNRMEEFEGENELYTIYVSKRNQGKAIGKQLLEAVLKAIPKNDQTMLVSVFEKNPYRSFYEKNGFSKIGEELVNLRNFHVNSWVLKTPSSLF
ncbi:MAG: N-acetyltransferase family protein [Saprospiraceae bacterium]